MPCNIYQTTSGRARLVVYPLIVGVLHVLTGVGQVELLGWILPRQKARLALYPLIIYKYIVCSYGGWEGLSW